MLHLFAQFQHLLSLNLIYDCLLMFQIWLCQFSRWWDYKLFSLLMSQLYLKLFNYALSTRNDCKYRLSLGMKCMNFKIFCELKLCNVIFMQFIVHESIFFFYHYHIENVQYIENKMNYFYINNDLNEKSSFLSLKWNGIFRQFLFPKYHCI